ncbi:MAG TPA: MBL fold metallo-hydrolase [Planctomycetia bacterium]|nr:MBL fold metallo-hydrolase [Planctomycetia bacterium]
MASFKEVAPDLFRWTDVCNVYALKAGRRAILFDLGDGSALDHLGEIGVDGVDWVLFTHHHREQCAGGERLAGRGIKVGASATERPFFENPGSFRKLKPSLSDSFAVHGASYVRPPLAPIKVDRAFAKMDDFAWGGREIWCALTPGNSPGHMSYLWKTPAGWVAVGGDVMTAGGKLHTWFDVEWDYGFGAGLYALGNSAALLAGFDPALLLPAHGPVVPKAKRQLDDYVTRLRKLGDVYLRGWEVYKFAGCDQDPVSRPTDVPHVWRVTPHLYKFRGYDYWPNFTILIADSGRGLIVDCGLFEIPFLDKAIDGMQKRLGLKGIDAIFVTHMHGDHLLQAPHLVESRGVKLWTADFLADTFARPEAYDMCAMIESYGAKTGKGTAIDRVAFDRLFRDGESFEWEGYQFAVDWMPGQTKYHACLHGTIDGRRVAFTGDNLFGSPSDPKQFGNEAVCARNGCILEEGYLYAADYLHGLNPDLIIGGHSWVIDKPAPLIERYRVRALALRDAFRELSAEEDYRLMFDPYWVRIHPYRTVVKAGETAEARLWVRNFFPRSEKFHLKVRTTPGFTCEPAALSIELPEGGSGWLPLKFKGIKASPQIGVAAFDVTVAGKRYGEWFDALVQVG